MGRARDNEEDAKSLRQDDAKARRVWSKNGWAAMAQGDGGFGLGAAATEDDAKAAALADAKKHGAKNPHIIVTQDSEGGYTRYPAGGFGGVSAAR